jgi:hypothetical protein
MTPGVKGMPGIRFMKYLSMSLRYEGSSSVRRSFCLDNARATLAVKVCACIYA